MTVSCTLSSWHEINPGELKRPQLVDGYFRIVIRIDDKEIIDASLEDETVIGTDYSTMLLGGFPQRGDDKDTQQIELGTSEPLIGCLSDFYLNYRFKLG